MRIDPSSNSSYSSLLPWFNNLANEASLEVNTDKRKNNPDKTIPELVDMMNKKLEELGTHIQVKVHDKTNTIMVLVMQDETNEIIREIPSEKMLDMLYNITRRVGLFVDEKL
ncbi:flagellar protein FlaG [Paenibacillus woosongensis]|uniref:Flagellar protein FlaG n=1 Tax=Paenibacillus woosongensis TaxID=307580 RepID=A0AA95I1B4_9BACL|nr:flagellar protein FlaG [Paenibacillus woosongensis]WHX48719.1 flagellar protein FlaG [Paenibacillus woosongensis]